MASIDFSLGSLVGGSDAEKRAANSVASGVEVFAGAFGVTYAQAKMPTYQTVAGIDTALIAGLLLSGAGMFDKSGKWGGHVSSLGHGALAAYGTKLAMSLAAPAPTPSPKGLGYGSPAFAVPANQSAWAR
jgi:hypothetical protein